jgi:radical SAM protein with 4Fe4S-binding SPASM domain
LALAKGALVALQVEITTRCPLSCVHCYNGPATDRVLDRGFIAKLLDEAADLGCLFLTLTGGEVFSHPDLRGIVADARARQFDVRLLSSGWFIDDEAAKFLAGSAVSQVDLSFYGAAAEVHDRVTGVPGSFARAVAAARRLRQRGVRVILKHIVLAGNAGEAHALRELAASLDCPLLTATVVTPEASGACGPCAHRAADEDLARIYGTELWGALADEFATSPGARAASDRPCLAGAISLFVAVDAHAYPCVDLRLDCGDLQTRSLASVWRDSKVLEAVRRVRWSDLPVCSGCALRSFCSHCMGLALSEHGDHLGPATESCRQAVVKRDLLRERGLLPPDATELPPPLRR